MSPALAKARAGDEDAFVVVWRALHPPLLRYLRVRGDDGPEDLASETWMHVVRGLGRFVGDAAEFRAWLFTIARNRAVDAGRARDPAAVGVPSPTSPSCTRTRAGRAAPSAEQQAIDERRAPPGRCGSWPPSPRSQAEMVMLRVVAGLDVADVAELLDKKPGTVRVTVHRALQTLARDQRAASPIPTREVV